jgi:hypothetical protein
MSSSLYRAVVFPLGITVSPPDQKTQQSSEDRPVFISMPHPPFLLSISSHRLIERSSSSSAGFA